VYFIVNSVKYWIMPGPSGFLLYKKEGSKTKYLGRQPLEEVKRLLAQAGAEVLQRIKSEVETVRQALERQKPAQTAQTPSLTWKKDGHTYWLLLYGKSIYVYMKGPTTRYKPKLVEKTDVSGVVGRLVAAGALHVLEALRALINGLYTAVSELLKPPAKTPAEESKKPQTPPSMPQASAEARREAPQASRREAEAALKELKHWLRKEVERWREKYSRRMESEGLYDVDPDWVREDFAYFMREYQHLLEKILPYSDLLDKFLDAAVEATYGYLTRSDVLKILTPSTGD
jgi:hypothetical protein